MAFEDNLRENNEATNFRSFESEKQSKKSGPHSE